MINLKSVDLDSTNIPNRDDFGKILQKIEHFHIDKKTFPQNNLDLANKKRTSLFPWRGQFSPGLIELLLNTYSKSHYTVFDPFAGSGTTLFEAARKYLSCIGTEIIPSAFEMSSTIHYVNLNKNEREKYIQQTKPIFERYLPSMSKYNLLSNNTGKNVVLADTEVYKKIINDSNINPYVHNIAVNTIMRFFPSNKKKNYPLSKKLLDAFKQHSTIIRSLPFNNKPCKMYHCDARNVPLDSNEIDIIITSPPYINVFNYHQNCRSAMELADWDLLKIAKSEIGANRKHRGNRFLTVIQYSIDMLQAFIEMKRIMKNNAKIIMVIGRESKVRHVSFENYKIISAIAIGGAGFKLECRQERKFVNRFGQQIFEDILHFIPEKESISNPNDYARAVGIYFLQNALEKAEEYIKKDIDSAIENAYAVKASPMFELKIQEDGKNE